MNQKTWKTIIPAAAALAAVIVSLPAAAHEGHHEQLGAVEAIRHLLTQPDHLAILAILVILAAVGGWQWRRARR
ncbi:MAG: HupE/UreJ family protein [Phenylobacterium sp.]